MRWALRFPREDIDQLSAEMDEEAEKTESVAGKPKGKAKGKAKAKSKKAAADADASSTKSGEGEGEGDEARDAGDAAAAPPMKRAMNLYFQLMTAAKKEGKASFEYNGCTYVGSKHERLGMIYKKQTD